MALPKAGHTKHNIHLTLDDMWILRAFQELLNIKVPKEFENAFIEQFKDLLLSKVTEPDFLEDLFYLLYNSSTIFKYNNQ